MKGKKNFSIIDIEELPDVDVNYNHIFPYSVEVELDPIRSDKKGRDLDTTTKYLSIGNIDCISEVINEVTEPTNVSNQTPIDDLYVVAAYNDGSVPFELVLASYNPYSLSDVVDKINIEDIQHTKKIGQHVSIQVQPDDSWHTGKNYYGVQNLAMALERAMLREVGFTSRDSYFWKYYKNRADRDSEHTDKYSAVNRKRVGVGHFLEFRLHHPIPSSQVFFEFFPYGWQMLSDKAQRIFRMMKNPMQNDKSFYLAERILEREIDDTIMSNLPLKWT